MASSKLVRLFVSDKELLDARECVDVKNGQALRDFLQIEYGKIGLRVLDWKPLKYHHGSLTIVKGQPKERGWLIIGPEGAFMKIAAT